MQDAKKLRTDDVTDKTRDTSERSGAAKFALEDFLPYRLSVLTNTISQGIARSYREPHDINVTEWRILAVLGRFPGLTASEVTNRTAMDKVAVSRGVKTLMAKGLLQRRTDRSDRRRQRLRITPEAGVAVLEEIIPQARRYERRLLENLTTEERATLSSLLSKLQSQAESL
jgi:DNA-binding MarR family transcriptional regulator